MGMDAVSETLSAERAAPDAHGTMVDGGSLGRRIPRRHVGAFARGQRALGDSVECFRGRTEPAVRRHDPWTIARPVEVTCAHLGHTRCLFGTDFSGLDMLAVQLKAINGLP